MLRNVWECMCRVHASYWWYIWCRMWSLAVRWWHIQYTGVEIRKLSLSVSSLISIFGLTSVRKIVLNQYKLSILALFTFKFLNFQWVNSTELKMISVSKLTKENKIYYNQVRMIGSSILFLIFVGYSEWKWVKIGPICIFWK